MKKNKKNWTPDTMFKALRKSIIGQDNYLKDLCSCIWLQYQKREHFIATKECLSQPKFNMLVIGKSGMGKTSSIKQVAKLLDMPVIIEDASEFRGAGWKGRQISEIVGDITKTVKQEYTDTDFESSSAFSIVVLDEIDKIFAERNQNLDSFSPANNLLKFIEGMKASYTQGDNKTVINTENLLFICVGAFDGLEEIIEKRIHPKSMGFSIESESIDDKNLLSHVTTEDLKAYGINEQFLGRLPFVSVMNELTEPDYKKILLESDISPIKNLNQLLINRQGVKLTITEEAAGQLASTVVEKHLGARGLQSEMILLLKDTIYQMTDECGVNEYRLEYDNGFKVGSYYGSRNRTSVKRKLKDYEIPDEEVKKLQMDIGILKENVDCIRGYTDYVFETYENWLQFVEKKSLSDDLSYQDIVYAKYLLASSITQLIIDAELNGVKRKMIQLMCRVMLFDIHKKNEYLHPLSADYESLSLRLQYLPDEKVEKLKQITWNIVKVYAIERYELEHEDEEALVLE